MESVLDMVPTALTIEQMLNELVNKALYDEKYFVLDHFKRNPDWAQEVNIVFVQHVLRYEPSISDEVLEMLVKRLEKTVKKIQEESQTTLIKSTSIDSQKRTYDDGDNDDEPNSKRSCRLEASDNTNLCFSQ